MKKFRNWLQHTWLYEHTVTPVLVFAYILIVRWIEREHR